MKSISLALATFAVLAAGSAHAFQGEQNPNPPAPFQSVASRAEVQAQAQQAQPISNGGTGVHRPTAGMVDRNAVRAGAVAAARRGSANYGTLGMPM